jgi:queuine/archaeosine tRNA-ribosyltransferase
LYLAKGIIDGITILPTFMPVATQAALKGLTPQQVEQLGEIWIMIVPLSSNVLVQEYHLYSTIPIILTYDLE